MANYSTYSVTPNTAIEQIMLEKLRREEQYITQQYKLDNYYLPSLEKSLCEQINAPVEPQINKKLLLLEEVR